MYSDIPVFLDEACEGRSPVSQYVQTREAEQVLLDYKKGYTVAEIAYKHVRSTSTIYRIIKGAKNATAGTDSAGNRPGVQNKQNPQKQSPNV